MSCEPPTMPGASDRIDEYPPAVGSDVMTSLATTDSRRAVCTSTIGDSPVTVIVSSSVPTFSSALTLNVAVPASSIPSRLTVLNPANANVTV
jgi:hypothetical protein